MTDCLFEEYLKQQTPDTILSLESFALAYESGDIDTSCARLELLRFRACGGLGKSLEEFNASRDHANKLRSAGRLQNVLPASPEPEPDAEREDAQLSALFFENGKFLHNVMGDYLREKHNVCKINGALHVYQSGIYVPGEDVLHGLMLELVPTLRDRQRHEVHSYLKASLKTPEKKVAPPNYIPFANKVYELSSSLFFDYHPDYVFLNKFPYDYNPAAPEAPRITQFLEDVCCGDGEVIKLLLEAMGNCFYLTNNYRGAVMLYGPSGNNGKSTLLHLLEQLVGKENASGLSMQDLTERFRLAGIYGKAVNIGDDIPETYIPDSSLFKRIVTGEEVTAENKGKDPYTFKPYAKLFFAMNALPPASDKSDAFYSRVLIVPMNRDFSKEPGRDVDLKNRRWEKEEMEYLTRLAVEGLKRLREQKSFTMPDCVAEAVAEYKADNNPVEVFLEEFGTVEEQPIQLVYNAYKTWCIECGHKNVLTRENFTRTVNRILGTSSYVVRHPFFGKSMGRCFVTR